MTDAQRAVQEAFVEAVAPFDAERHLRNAAPAELLLQFARGDRHVSENDAMRLVKAAGERAVVRWYEGGHEFNDVRALPDRAEFLREHVGIGSIGQLLREATKSENQR